MAIVNRAVVHHKADPNAIGVGELELVNRPMPEASPGRVVVHILLRPINPPDLSSPAARYGHAISVPGPDGFGIVHSVGEGVTRVKPGQRVVPFLWEGMQHSGDGSWQEYVSVREEMLMLVPDSISDEVAAQSIINPWTAVGLMRDLGTPPGDYMLQTAAGSVLGRLIIQLAKHKGVKTINIVRREEQKEELKALGADEVICSTTEDVVARVKEITNNKLAYGALDCVGGQLTKVVASSVRNGGTVLVYGLLSGTDCSVEIYDLLRQVILRGWLIMNYWGIEEHRNMFITEAWKLLESKIIEPMCAKKYGLSEFREALRVSESVGRGGKVVLETKL